jgi:hypothetical protein
MADRMERYHSYVALMTKDRGEILPIGDFSPMGERQKLFLEQLIAIDAEKVAAETCLSIAEEFSQKKTFRILLVVIDEPKNGWTQRYLTDATWRFSDDLEQLSTHNTGFDRWIVVQLWTTDHKLNAIIPSSISVSNKVKESVARAYYQSEIGYAKNLFDMLRQEACVQNYLDIPLPVHHHHEISIISQYLSSTSYPVNFALLYGDVAATSVGYQAFGLSHFSGLNHARQIVNSK